MAIKFPYQGFLVTLDDINTDGSLRKKFHDIAQAPDLSGDAELVAIISTVKAEGSVASITRTQILRQADNLDMSTQEFEKRLYDIANREPRLHS